MNLQNLEVRELTLEEKREIDGGWILVALAVVALIIVGVGMYNGYHDTKQDAK